MGFALSTAASPENGRVDILLASYNGGKYIEELISSLQNQSYQNWRLIISDDGSTDDTLEIVRDHARADRRILEPILHRSTGHPKDNFFYLISLVDASAEYVAFCDQDDIWMADKLQKLVDEVQGDAPALAFSDLEIIDSCGAMVERSFMELPSFNPNKLSLSTLMVQNSTPGCSMLMNRKLYDLVVIPSVTSEIEMHDWWIMLIAATFGDIKFINEPLIKYRRHSENASGELKQSLIKGIATITEVFNSHSRAQMQSLQFYVTYKELLDRKEKELLCSYGLLLSQSRLGRIRTVNTNCFWRISSISARCAQLMYLLYAKRRSVAELISMCSAN